MKKLGRGISDFRKVITSNNYFVDKTLMIKDIIDNNDEVVLITRPRRFGKTLNMSMLSEFFDITKDSQELFKETQIYQTDYMKYINQYPVVYISFKNCKGNRQNLVSDLKDNILNLYFEHEYIFKDLKSIEKNKYIRVINSIDNENEEINNSMQKSLYFLIKKLYDYYHQKVIIIIDEYDMPFIESKVNGYYDDIHDSLSGILSSILKDNQYLYKGILTGIQRVAKENIFSGLNNITVCTVVDELFSQYFGFTEEETRILLEYYGLELSEEVKEMYDGYRIGNSDMYNPWSIINYAITRILDRYWINTSANHMIRESMKKIDIKEMKILNEGYDELILKGQLKTTLNLTNSFYEESSVEALWGLFVNAGYLTVKGIERKPYSTEYILEIPNREVRSEFEILTADRIKCDVNELYNMFRSLLNKEVDRFIYYYKEVLGMTSYHDLISENSYHMFMLGIFTYLRGIYEIDSNREQGEGRYDIRLKRKTEVYPNIIIELKNEKEKEIEKSAEEALKQIIAKRYDEGLEGEILYIGIAHKGKEVKAEYKIERR